VPECGGVPAPALPRGAERRCAVFHNGPQLILKTVTIKQIPELRFDVVEVR
jgi:hypothetical protein